MTESTPGQAALREQAGALRLHGLLAHWAEVMGHAEHARWVAQMLGWEAAERAQRSLQLRLRVARIGRFKPLADFDWAWPRSIDRGAVEELYVSVKDQSTNAGERAKKSSHNIEHLRELSATHDDSFKDVDICDFTRDLAEKTGELFQFLRYVSHETTFGFSTDFSKLAPAVDKIFFYSLLNLPEPHRKMLVFCSTRKQLITGSQFDQSRNRQLLLKALQNGNPCFDEFISYCREPAERAGRRSVRSSPRRPMG